MVRLEPRPRDELTVGHAQVRAVDERHGALDQLALALVAAFHAQVPDGDVRALAEEQRARAAPRPDDGRRPAPAHEDPVLLLDVDRDVDLEAPRSQAQLAAERGQAVDRLLQALAGADDDGAHAALRGPGRHGDDHRRGVRVRERRRDGVDAGLIGGEHGLRNALDGLRGARAHRAAGALEVEADEARLASPACARDAHREPDRDPRHSLEAIAAHMVQAALAGEPVDGVLDRARAGEGVAAARFVGHLLGDAARRAELDRRMRLDLADERRGDAIGPGGGGRRPLAAGDAVLICAQLDLDGVARVSVHHHGADAVERAPSDL